MTKKKPYLSGFPMFFDFITVKLPVSLGEDTGYQAEAHALAYGRYPLTASRPCLFQIDGGSEQRHASVELQSSAMRQIDVIVERFDDRPQQTTKLIL